MENNNFSSSFSAAISAEEAIRKISMVPEWWGVSFDGNSEKQGDKFTIKMGGDSFFDVTVSELIPGKRVAWLVTDCNMPWYTDKKEWAGNKLIFDLKENNGETELTFTHDGLRPEVECYKDCAPGWTHWIKTSLFPISQPGKVFSERQPSKRVLNSVAQVFYFDKQQSMTNKKYIPANYTVDLELAKSPAYVFDHLIQLSKWWPEEFEGESVQLNAEFVLKTGDSHFPGTK